MAITRFRFTALFALALFGPLASCRENPAKQSDPSAQSAASGGSSTSSFSADTPLQAARLLHELHETREYGKMAELIVEQERASTLRALIALDDAIAANADLRRTAETAYSGPQQETWDIAAMENNLGVFSKVVSFISVSYRGEEAIVTLQESDQLPLVHIRFVPRDGRWLLLPEHLPETLPAELNALARLIREVEGEVARGASLNTYVDAFFHRVLPQMRRVVSTGHRPSPALTARAPGVD
jgi:hypothetical protein